MEASQEYALEVMGSNHFGTEGAAKHFSASFPPTFSQKIPVAQADLVECRNTHILVAVPDLSIVNIYNRFVPQNPSLFPRDPWIQNQLLGKQGGNPSWQLVRKTPVEHSMDKWFQPLEEQQALLAPNEEIPSARVMIYTIISHYLATGKRLFVGTPVYTSSVDSRGHPIFLTTSSGKLVISSWRERMHGPLYVGVTSARKLPA